jgi:Ca2+-binding RTX toxin-like protein
MRIPATSLAIALAFALPATASASTIDSAGGVMTFRSGAEGSDFVLLASPDPFTHTFTDAGSALSAGAGCEAGPPAMCHGVSLDMQLAGGSDIAKAFGPLDVSASGGSGRDQIYAGGNHNEVTAGTGDDLAISNSNSAGNVFGEDGDDTLYGFGTATHLVGGGGDDFAVGEASASNQLEGSAGHDTLVGVLSSFGSGTLSGGTGSDLLLTLGDTTGSGWTFDGGSGADTIVGSSGADTVSGGSGTDLIDVRDGVADTVDCGSGIDVVWADRDDVVTHCEAVLHVPAPNSPCVTRALARAEALKTKVHAIDFRSTGPIFGS